MDLVAFISDVDEGFDDLFLDVQRVEAEQSEVLGEVMRRDGDHTVVRHLLLF